MEKEENDTNSGSGSTNNAGVVDNNSNQEIPIQQVSSVDAGMNNVVQSPVSEPVATLTMPEPGPSAAQMAMPQPAMPQPAMPQPAMPQPAMPQPAMPQPAMPQMPMPAVNQNN